jgi:hypothetical protein
LRTRASQIKAVDLIEIGDQPTLTFTDHGDEAISVDRAEVIRYGIGSEARSGQGLFLIDGSLLVGRITRLSTDSCDLTNQFFRTTVPRSLIRAVLLSAPSIDGLQTRLIDRAMASEGVEDGLLTVDGDWIQGTLAIDPLEKFFAAGDAPTLRWKQSDGQRDIPLGEVRGIVFSPILTPLIPADFTSSMVGLVDGTRLRISDWSTTDDEFPIWELRCGLVIEPTNPDFSPAAISYFRGGNPGEGQPSPTDRFLAIDQALRVQFTPPIGAPTLIPAASLRPTDAVLGIGCIYLTSGWVDRSWTLPAGGQAVFRVDRTARHLTAEVARGRDPWDVTTPVRFTVAAVVAGGRIEPIWSSQPVGAEAGPVYVDVTIPESLAVVLAVQRVEGTTESGHGVWINPMIRAPAP